MEDVLKRSSGGPANYTNLLKLREREEQEHPGEQDHQDQVRGGIAPQP